ncbi:MAG: FAD-dependent oxidoreductase [Chitinophagaceae bacterium]|nr:FAD-dependent oxidoreductase [Anaerolineae bacterium]
MRDVVVIGGGLSGLAAAYELEKRGVSYTLIEVKRRLGGSIASTRLNGFMLDSGAMLHTIQDVSFFTAYLNALDLKDALFTQESNVGFLEGTGALIDALARKITAPVMYRMAVSTLGQTDSDTFLICMENGMVLDTRALIVAAPARYAERMFQTLTPEISYRLLGYRYDEIARVSLGYPTAELHQIPSEPPPDYPITFIEKTAQSGRVPADTTLIQVGVRYDSGVGPSRDLVGEVAALFGWPLSPLAEKVAAWADADPLMWHDPTHPTTMMAIQHLLPQGVALAGSDYVPTTHPPTLDDRIQLGREAAEKVMAWLARGN